MFGGSSQFLTTAERAVTKSNCRVKFRQHSRKLGGAAEHLIDGSEKRICRLSVRMLFESAVNRHKEVCLKNRWQDQYIKQETRC